MALVYKHTTLDTNEIFYIGIGTKIIRAYSKRNRTKFWFNVVNKHGYKVDILYNDICYELALKKERELVLLYGRRNINTGCLVNLTDGGLGSLGYKPTKETLEKISLTSKGRKWTEEQKVRWKSKMTFIVSPETREKLRIINTGKKKSEQSKNKMRENRLGKKLSEQAKQKLRDYYKNNPTKWKGTKLSEEQRKKISISHTGKFGILSSNKKAVIKLVNGSEFEYFSIEEAAKQNNLCSLTISNYIKAKTRPKDNSSWYFKNTLDKIKKVGF